jgi:predicted ATPase/DNA-binding XRE family transcriptional regulator
MVRDTLSDAPAFGELLRHHRRARDLTQEALAERAGVSVRAVSDLERGARSHPYRETAILLAEALGLAGSERSALLTAARRPLPPAGPIAPVGPGARLPRPLTRLIGRGEEQREIAGLVRDDRVRLVTLTGPGGVGKTRLAVTAAAGLGDAFRDGVVFVDLAPLSDPALAVSAVADALGLTDAGAISRVETVRRRLASRQMLLVLDNFEHLLAAAPLLTDLLQAAPKVQMLVTSRATLRLHGEREYPVSPLPTPDATDPVSPEDLAGWEAVQLFAERAGEAHPGFQLTPENASAIAAICARLDGLPLAIELAAARVKLMTPANLLDRLDRRFPLLTAGMRDAPPRQRTLQAAIAWSYDLLTPEQQTLLCALSVFVGGWSLEGAEDIGARLGAPDPLDALAALVEHNLVVQDATNVAARYRLLETIRELAHDRLVTAGEEERTRRAHLAYLVQLARENDLERLDARVGERLARLQREDANLHAGIAWAIETDPESALILLTTLGPYWFLADRIGTFRDLYQRALVVAPDDRPLRLLALQQATAIANIVGDHTAMAPLAEATRALAERLGDARNVAFALMHQGDFAVSQGDAEMALSLHDAALAQFILLDDHWGMFCCITELGIAAQQRGDPEAAVEHFERLGALVAEYRLPARYQAHYLVDVADAYRQIGRHDDAMDACREALRLGQEAGWRSVTAAAQHLLCRLLLDAGVVSETPSLLLQCLVAFWETGDNWNLTQALELAAPIMVARDRPEPAARMLGAAAALREWMPYLVGADERDVLARWQGEARAILGEVAYVRAWTTGKAQPLDATVAEARALFSAMTRR